MKALAFFKGQPKPVIYEVRLEVDPGIADDFDDWLLGHVREMLAFPGFQTANVHRGQEPDASHRVTRLVVYEVRSQRELNSYLHTHAPRMRKDGVTRFGKQFNASRRILPAAEHALPEGFALLYDRKRISSDLPVCGNCHQPVPGRFCVHCGQEDRSYVLSLRELAGDFMGDLFNYDSRFFRTMGPLLFRPGLLTTEYLRGRRQRYLPPVRMYIFISLVFFLFAAWLTNEAFAIAPAPEDIPVAETEVTVDGRDLSPEERAEVERALNETSDALGLPEGTLQLPQARNPGTPAAAEQNTGSASGESEDGDQRDEDANIDIDGFGGGEFEERLEEAAENLRTPAAARDFAQKVLQQIPTMMFVFLPMIALMLKVLYIGSGRYYVEHLIFTLHFHSAVFVLLLAWLLFGEIAALWTPLQALSGWITAAVWIYLPFYLYKSMRRVYGQGRFFTILKYFLLLFAYFFALMMTLLATVVYTLYLQS